MSLASTFAPMIVGNLRCFVEQIVAGSETFEENFVVVSLIRND